MAWIKVLWQNHKVEKATWEGEKDMKSKYLHLFSAPRIRAEGMCLLTHLYFQSV